MGQERSVVCVRPRRYGGILDHFTNLICDVIATAGGVMLEVTFYWIKVAYDRTVMPLIERRRLTAQIKNAPSFQEWQQHAVRLDEYSPGIRNDKWRRDPRSKDYDYELIQTRLEQFHRARELDDIVALSFLIRTSISRNFGDMGNPSLYSTAHSGTKFLIEEFTNEIVAYLNILSQDIEKNDNPAELKAKIDYFKSLRHALGNTALLLSGGATLGIYHIGVLKALFQANLLPRIISGSSAGAIVASIACTRSAREYDDLLRLQNINLNFFIDDNEESVLADIWIKLRRLFRKGTLFESNVLIKCVQENLGNITFLEAYRKTQRVLNITVSSSTVYEMPRLLNYITAPNVVIWSAVVASCAVPGLFTSAQIMAKDRYGNFVPWNNTEDKWIDGSVENDLPMKRLAELFNVNHFIVSQVNPHVNPFLTRIDNQSSFVLKFLSKLWFLFQSEAQFRLKQLQQLGILPMLCHSIYNILEQKYQGDITITPSLAFRDILRMAASIKTDDVRSAVRSAELATWPKISIIKNHCQIELNLDEILIRLKERLFNLSPKLSANNQLNSSSPLLPHSNNIRMAYSSTNLEDDEIGTVETDVMYDPVKAPLKRHNSDMR